MTLLERVHGQFVHGRRVRVLGERIGKLIPDNCSILDVGCGDGQLAQFIQTRQPTVQITGVEVLPRPDALIPTVKFDGRTLPWANHSVDIVVFVDVLHHTADPLILLREAARVARRNIVLKDHLLEGFLAGPTLRWMDRVGNARHGVALPHNYWTRAQWRVAFASLGLTIDSWDERLALYPWPADWAFGRSLHFLAKLVPEAKSR